MLYSLGNSEIDKFYHLKQKLRNLTGKPQNTLFDCKDNPNNNYYSQPEPLKQHAKNQLNENLHVSFKKKEAKVSQNEERSKIQQTERKKKKSLSIVQEKKEEKFQRKFDRERLYLKEKQKVLNQIDTLLKQKKDVLDQIEKKINRGKYSGSEFSINILEQQHPKASFPFEKTTVKAPDLFKLREEKKKISKNPQAKSKETSFFNFS